MSGDGQLGETTHLAPLALNVAGKRRFFHPSMHPGFFESLEGSSLGVG